MPRKLSLARALIRALDGAATPVYLLDGQRRIVYGNPAFSAWLGRPAEELAGVRCDYHASGEVGGSVEQAAGLCPPPDAFAGRLAAGMVARIGAGDRLDQRPARFVPLAGEGLAGLLIVVDPLAGVGPAEQGDAAQLAPQWLHTLLQQLRGELGRRFHIGQLVGQSDPLRRVREQVRIAIAARTRVLVVGPPGSGREHVARTIHYGQPAASIGPLVPIDCPIVNAEHMQATLTAVLRRQADANTERPPAALLLDVDRLRPDAQQELAGFLLLPGVELHTLATARFPLQRLAARGKFRRDVAYALSTLTIALPPLKSRGADVPLLAQFFLEEFNAQGNKQLAGFAPPALDKLLAYDWPGNVDELALLVREACQRATGPLVATADLPERLHLAAGALAHPPREVESIQLDDFLADIERELLQRALRTARGNKSKAAQLLGISRGRLLRRLAQLGLAPAVPTSDDEPVVFEPLEEGEGAE
ncbi:MAG: helix-turn-helix domain-containing protein [Pirellulaceae bacterium]|nr:helix-turn-helix domain-containing protein [Pirellulaceae bacterium]